VCNSLYLHAYRLFLHMSRVLSAFPAISEQPAATFA
jgi:hypothetical protein